MPIACLLLYTIASMLWYSWHKKRVCAQHISSMHAFHRTAFGLPSRRPVVKTLNDILDNETASTQRTKQSQGKSVSDAKGGNGKDCVDIDEKVALEDVSRKAQQKFGEKEWSEFTCGGGYGEGPRYIA